MSATLSSPGGASCQLYTAIHTQLKDLNLIRDGFSINRFIHDAKSLFNDVGNQEEFLKLDSNRDTFKHILRYLKRIFSFAFLGG